MRAGSIRLRFISHWSRGRYLHRTTLLISQMSSVVSCCTRNSPIRTPDRLTGPLIARSSRSSFSGSRQGESLPTTRLGEQANTLENRAAGYPENPGVISETDHLASSAIQRERTHV